MEDVVKEFKLLLLLSWDVYLALLITILYISDSEIFIFLAVEFNSYTNCMNSILTVDDLLVRSVTVKSSQAWDTTLSIPIWLYSFFIFSDFRVFVLPTSP